MRIGIDIDGTINNLADVVRPLLEIHYGIKPIYDQYNLFGDMTSKQIDEFEKRFHATLMTKVKPLKNAKNVIHKLKKDGHSILIITARDAEKDLKSTIDWFKINNFDLNDFDGFCFNKHNKAETCIDYNVDLMIDDCPKHLIDLWANDISTLKINHPYNVNVLSTYSAYNWDEIFDIIG